VDEDSLVHVEPLRLVPGGPRVGLSVGEHDHAITIVGGAVHICDPLAVSHVALQRVGHWVGRGHEPQVNVRRILLVTAPNGCKAGVCVEEEREIVQGLELREKCDHGLVLVLVCHRKITNDHVV